MHVSLRGKRHVANGYSGKIQEIHEKGKFPRFSVMKRPSALAMGDI